MRGRAGIEIAAVVSIGFNSGLTSVGDEDEAVTPVGVDFKSDLVEQVSVRVVVPMFNGLEFVTELESFAKELELVNEFVKDDDTRGGVL